MQGILLIFYTKRKHLIYLDDIETEFTRTGFGGIWGNKGGVSIRITYQGCGIIFLNSHLAAHDREMNERIADYRQILDNHHCNVYKFREIFDHNCVFWFGDLNFRIHFNDDTSPDHILRLIKKNKYSELLERDQLNIVRRQGKAFYQLKESDITFLPTFKFDEGTSNYSLKRRPAWTDRILWRLQNDKKYHITQLSYKSHPDYMISDHKPVTAEFEVQIKIPDTQWQSNKVLFTYIPSWNLGAENVIEISFPENFKQNDSDWIGIYKNDFSSLVDFIAYEYTNQPGSTKIIIDPNDSETKKIIMSEKTHLVDGVVYIILFFSNNFQRGTSSIAGLSNEFKARSTAPECPVQKKESRPTVAKRPS